ncbi:MAG: hypothetical protein CM15mP31_3530 [Gammaproteobacteria bacterium]|nr:MAG: hypothetical protein CM15mP31_3530 [Gammaproteobacteria bacterium]
MWFDPLQIGGAYADLLKIRKIKHTLRTNSGFVNLKQRKLMPQL